MKNKPYPLYPLRPVTTLREMVEAKANSCPDEVAFRYMIGHRALVERTYGQFYRDIRALGTYLLKRRITGKKIALICENSYQWLLGYFTIVTTGNVAVLVSRDATPAEAALLVFQSEADIVVYSNACSAAGRRCRELYGRKKRFFTIDMIQKWLIAGQRLIDRGKDLYERKHTDPDALCTIFFTSGSTGISKGVMLSQNHIMWDIHSAMQLVRPFGSTMSVLPFTHAFGLMVGLLAPFQCQMPIFICSSLANFMREIPIAKPTMLVLVPLFVETFSRSIWRTAERQNQAKTLRRGLRASDLMRKVGIDRRRTLFDAVLSKFGDRLEFIICGGAPLDPRYVKEFRSFGIEILNGYGITECAPVLAVNRNHYHRDGSVGLPLPCVEVKIDRPDAQGRGEIIVKGPNVMLGYYNDPQSTAEQLQGGWFHTGDLGYQDADGFLFITGRKKSLIILANGENVSPEELEQYVERINEVQEVVVYADEDAITAEVYPDTDSGLSREELLRRIQKQIDKLNASLPNHKHIRKIKLRDTEFEKTSTRKIKRYQTGTKKQETTDSAE